MHRGVKHIKSQNNTCVTKIRNDSKIRQQSQPCIASDSLSNLTAFSMELRKRSSVLYRSFERFEKDTLNLSLR